MTSTRLPGKVLLPLCGQTVLEVMLDRLKAFKEHIVVATTDDGSEAPIVALCEKLAIPSFRGDTDNVLKRYYQCAETFARNEDGVIVRLTSDCPLIDPEIVRQTVAFFEAEAFDYVSNCVERTFPRGFDCEVFTLRALEKAYNDASTPFEQEHVTTYIHTTHKDAFKIGSFCDVLGDRGRKYRLTLDEEADYEVIKAVYRLFDCRTDFGYEELLERLAEHPEIYEMNRHVEQKKL